MAKHPIRLPKIPNAPAKRLVPNGRSAYITPMKNLIPFRKKPPLVAVIRLEGMIASSSGPGRGPALNDTGLAQMIEKAFRKGKPAAVALAINSPGGSPVQSSLIAARIRRLADEKNIPVYAFVEDVAASGGYWLACAADEIWADHGSVVGSIGVISAGFGFQELIERYGIERRMFTAGKNKSTLDPFQPQKPADVKRYNALLTDMHGIFKSYVTERRGDRLSADKDLFTGEFWLAGTGQELGLVDGIGHLVPKMKELYGDKVRLVPYRQKRSMFSRFGAQLATDAIGGLEERAAFARFGA